MGCDGGLCDRAGHLIGEFVVEGLVLTHLYHFKFEILDFRLGMTHWIFPNTQGIILGGRNSELWLFR